MLRLIIEDDYIKYRFNGGEEEIIDRFGLCPVCRGMAEFDEISEYYRCRSCNWEDINLPEIVRCAWCGELEVSAMISFHNNEGICRDCQKSVTNLGDQNEFIAF